MADRVQYTVNLASKDHVERVSVRECGRTKVGTLYRFGQPVRTFVVTPAQAKKIKVRKGKINITSKAIDRARTVGAWCQPKEGLRGASGRRRRK